MMADPGTPVQGILLQLRDCLSSADRCGAAMAGSQLIRGLGQECVLSTSPAVLGGYQPGRALSPGFLTGLEPLNPVGVVNAVSVFEYPCICVKSDLSFCFLPHPASLVFLKSNVLKNQNDPQLGHRCPQKLDERTIEKYFHFLLSHLHSQNAFLELNGFHPW